MNSAYCVIVLLAVYSSVTRTGGRVLESQQENSKRSAVISLPNLSILKFTSDVIVPVIQLINSTNTYLWFDFPSYWKIPNAANIHSLYQSLHLAKRSYGVELDEQFVEEQRANKERREIYKSIEQLFSNFGADGKTCLQRIICEISDAPLSGNGLFGQVIQLLLTPSLITIPEKGNLLQHDIHSNLKSDPALEFIFAPIDDEYTVAHRIGKEGACSTRFACPFSPFRMMVH